MAAALLAVVSTPHKNIGSPASKHLGEPALRTVIALLIATCLSAASAEAGVQLAWDANTEPDIAGYRLSYGTASGQYTTTIDVGNVTTFDVFRTRSVREVLPRSPRI